MIKRIQNENVFKFERRGKIYLVLLINEKNSVYGSPNFRAFIVDQTSDSASQFKFRGHYLEDAGEAEFILEYFLAEIVKG